MILKWRDYLGLPGGSSVITRVLLRERQDNQSQRETMRDDGRLEAEVRGREDVQLLALKMEEGHKPKNVSGLWKDKEVNSS